MTVCGGDSRLTIQVLKLVIPTNDDAPWILRDKCAGTKNKVRFFLLTVKADLKFYQRKISVQEAAQGVAIFGSDVSSPPTKGSGKAKRKPRATPKKKMEQLSMTQCTPKDSQDSHSKGLQHLQTCQTRPTLLLDDMLAAIKHALEGAQEKNQ